MSRTTSIRPTLRLAVVGALASLALTGCEISLQTSRPGEETTPAATEEPAGADATDTDTTDTDTTDTDAPADDTTDEQPQAAGEDEATEDATGFGKGSGGADRATDPSGEDVPAPGSVFDVGDTVTTHVQALEPGDEFYGHATLATTITSISEGDGSLFASAANADQLEGFSEWFVQVEHEWLTFEGEPLANMVPTFVGYTDSGVQVLPSYSSSDLAGIPGCSIDLPPTEDRGVGAQASDCMVFAIPDGLTLKAVGWTGDDLIDGDGDANPYYDDPVLWVQR